MSMIASRASTASLRSDHPRPLNLGSDELISIDGLVDLVREIAGKTLHKRHDVGQPQGVRGRNSDNSLLRQVLGWEPRIPLETGLERTYRWIRSELAKGERLPDRTRRRERDYGMNERADETCMAGPDPSSRSAIG